MTSGCVVSKAEVNLTKGSMYVIINTHTSKHNDSTAPDMVMWLCWHYTGSILLAIDVYDSASLYMFI